MVSFHSLAELSIVSESNFGIETGCVINFQHFCDPWPLKAVNLPLRTCNVMWFEPRFEHRSVYLSTLTSIFQAVFCINLLVYLTWAACSNLNHVGNRHGGRVTVTVTSDTHTRCKYKNGKMSVINEEKAQKKVLTRGFRQHSLSWRQKRPKASPYPHSYRYGGQITVSVTFSAASPHTGIHFLNLITVCRPHAHWTLCDGECLARSLARTVIKPQRVSE